MPPSSLAQQNLTILSFNIRHGAGMDGRVDLSRAAALINRLKPDIVALQEVDKGTGRTGGVDQAAWLGQETGMEAVFGEFMPYQGGRYGMAVLSRLPIIEWDNHRLPDGAEPRTTLSVVVRYGDQEIVVAGIHLYRSEQERLAQARRLVQIFATERRPVFLVGDFNSTPASPVMDLLERHWTRVTKQGNSQTFPADTPETEIDFILFRPADAFQVVESRVVEETLASDHRPVLAIFQRRE